MKPQNAPLGEQYGKLKRYSAIKTRLICGGLIAIELITLQAFISTGVFVPVQSTPTARVPVVVEVLDWPALITVIALALSLPLLSALVLTTFEETSREYIVTDARILKLTYWVGTVSALVGIASTFWYIWPGAGVLTAVSIVLGAIIYMGYSSRLVRLDEWLKAHKYENTSSEIDGS